MNAEGACCFRRFRLPTPHEVYPLVPNFHYADACGVTSPKPNNQMKRKSLLDIKLMAALTVSAAGTASAWTLAVDNFDSYEDGVALNAQTGHGGVGFDGDWIETLRNDVWIPLYASTSDSRFDGAVVQDGKGVISGGGRHMRALSQVMDTGVVYLSVLMTNIADGTGSSQFHLHSDTPIKDAEGTVTNGLADLIGGVRYDEGVIQIIDTSYAHVDDDPETEADERRNLDAIIPGRDGLTDDDPPQIAYREYWTLAETYVDVSVRDTPVSSSILWVIEYDMDNSTMSYYAFLPGDALTPEGATYAVVDHPVNAARKLPLGAISVAAFREGVLYESVKVGTTWGDVVPVNNAIAQAPMLRAPVTIDGVVDAAWSSIPAQSYDLKHGDGTQPASASDASGTWKAAWDLDNLYLLFEVTDDEHFEGTDDRQDQIEFWTDTDLSRNHTDADWPAVYDRNDTQWVTQFVEGLATGEANRWQQAGSPLPADRKDISELGDASLVVAGVVESLESGVLKTVEVSVSWADLGMDGPPSMGQKIGFETQLNDRDATTGNNGEGNPLYASDGKAAWADGNNRAWISPSSFGILEFTPPVTPILNYDFSDLTVGEVVAAAGTDDENWAGPWVEAWRPSWATQAAIGAELDPFIGDLAQAGQGMVGVNAGRLSRTMDVTFDTGVVWTSFVVGAGTASTQFWLGDSAAFDLNDNSGITAGVRLQGGSVQVINTTLSRDSLENYVGVGVYPNAPILAVIRIDYDNSTVGYWIFESGLPIDPASPAAFYEFSLPRNMTLNPFSGVAWAGFSSRSVVSNLRVGDQLSQVVPSAGMQYNCPVLVSELHEAVTVDGSVVDFAWERTSGLALTNFWGDGGNNVLPSSAADFSAAFHTGWNGDKLYMAIIVDDDDVRNSVDDGGRDAVEIYLDGDNNDSNGTGWPIHYDGVDDFQLMFHLDAAHANGAELSGASYGNGTGNPDGYKGAQGATEGQDFAGIAWQATATETGYVLEVEFDMTIVPGFAAFLANGLMGLDVAVVDNDDSGTVDGEGNPVIEKSHAFFCDDANWNWNGTGHFGTAYVASAKPALAMFADGSANVALAGDAAAGNGTAEINTNFTDTTYTVSANQAWVTIDFDPGIGTGEVEFSWEANTGLYQRSARVQLSDVNALNRVDIVQAGIAPEAMKAFFPTASVGASDGWAVTFLGDVHYGTFPWVYAVPMQWLHPFEGSAWMYSLLIGDFLHTSEATWPLVYFYGEGSLSQGWKLAVEVEGAGIYLFDFDSGLYSTEPVFPF